MFRRQCLFGNVISIVSLQRSFESIPRGCPCIFNKFREKQSRYLSKRKSSARSATFLVVKNDLTSWTRTIVSTLSMPIVACKKNPRWGGMFWLEDIQGAQAFENSSCAPEHSCVDWWCSLFSWVANKKVPLEGNTKLCHEVRVSTS